MEQEADDGRADAEGDHERRIVLETVHLLEQQADDDQDESVTGIAHAEGEEQQEEDGDERRGVEAVVGRTAVHVGEDLEHLHELVVAETDGRIVLHRGRVLEVVFAGRVQGLGHGLLILRGRITHEGDEGVFRCGDGGLGSEIQVQVGEIPPGRVLDLSTHVLHAGEDRFLLVDIGLEGGDARLDVGDAGLGAAFEGVRKRVFAHDDVIDLPVQLIDDRKGVLVGPFGLEGLGGGDMEMDRDPGVFHCTELVAVILAPGLARGGFLFGGLERILEFGEMVQGGFRRLFRVAGNGGVRKAFRNLHLVQGLQQGVPPFRIREDGGGLVVDRLHAAGNVHEADFLELLQEAFLVPLQEDEGVFGHRGNHDAEASSSSSSAAWRCLTIFWDALERFSSSSMYRLILRIASW